MGCKNCDKAQKENFGTFIRVGKANIFISGCKDHLGKLITRNRQFIEKDTEK